MMPSEGPQIVRPTPRRPFNHNDKLSMPPSPLLSPSIANQPDSPSASVSRSHSVLNLTSSTLLGIYSRTGLSSDREEQSTPWGTGSETPISDKPFTLYRRRSIAHPAPPSTRAVIFSLALRSVLLFCLGMLYGLLVRHLHDDGQLAPFQVEGILKPSYDWRYFVFWGVAGVALGSLLPWVDTFWEENAGASENLGSEQGRTASPDKEKDNYTGILGADWTPVIRSVGAFVGIAYAIRKLPWASTLQASLTLALVNPALWYIIDRSKPGFVLSSGVGFAGTAVLLGLNPDMMPSPAVSGESLGLKVGQYVSKETIEGGIWILSVLFCSCVCFGNIGRRLALNIGMEQVAVGRKTADSQLASSRGRSSR